MVALVHEVPDSESSPQFADAPGTTTGTGTALAGPETAHQAQEDAELAAYNEYLAQLAERDRATDR